MVHPKSSQHFHTKYFIFIDINHINVSIDHIYHRLQEIIVYQSAHAGKMGVTFET